ncbi:MAG: hypothetical protein U1F10_14335 [Burkholderiales bacterium]
MYWTDFEPHGVLQHFYGDVSGEERLAGLTVLLDDRRTALARYVIIDFTGAAGIAMSYSQMETLVSLMNSTLASVNPDVLLVYVLEGEAAQAHFQRVLDVAPIRHVGHVGRTLDEARDWIAGHVPA